MLSIKLGDIAKENTEAIVNAANSRLAGGGGVDGAIHKAAGPEILKECSKIEGCPTGDARITGAGKLKAKHIIHAVGPVWHGGSRNESQLLKSAYEKCFILAKENGLRSISFPAISTGVYKYPIEEAALIALSMGKKYENDFQEIRYICFSKKDYDVYRKVSSSIK